MGAHFFLATISRFSLSIFKTLFLKGMHDNVVLVVSVFAQKNSIEDGDDYAK